MDNLPPICMTLLNSTGEPIAIKLGETGYWPMHGYDPDEFNKERGVTPAHVAAMEAGSLFGWHVPAANPEHASNASLVEFPYEKRKELGEQTRLRKMGALDSQGGGF